MQKILQSSTSYNIEMLDTATDYCKVEEKLGKLNINDLKIISKDSQKTIMLLQKML